MYTLGKNVNATLSSLLPFFMSRTQRSKTFSQYTKEPFLLNTVHQSAYQKSNETAWMLHRCATKGHSKMGNLAVSGRSFQILATWGHCMIMMQHEVTVMDNWHNNGPQDVVTVSLCIQYAINKTHLCSLSRTYACPDIPHRPHGPLEPQHWYRQTAHPHDTAHAVCHLSWNSDNRDSSVKRTPLQHARHRGMWAIAHSSRFTTTGCSQGRDPD